MTFNEYMSLLQSTDGAGSRGIIIAMLNELNKGGKLPDTWHGLTPDKLCLKSELPSLFMNEQAPHPDYDAPYYITEINETNGLQEGKRERAVCSFAIANLFGDIDAAYKSICGTAKYNERMHNWNLLNLKPEGEPFVRL